MFFYFHILNNIYGLSNLFYQHIQLRFAHSHLVDSALEETFQQIFSQYWATEERRFVSMKIGKQQRYNMTLQHVFRKL